LSILRKNSAICLQTPRGAGHFSDEDIFNDDTEEALAAEGCPLHEGAPTVAEMLDVALGIVSQNPRFHDRGGRGRNRNNFANNNAAGTLKH